MKRTRTFAVILALAGGVLLLVGLIAPLFLADFAPSPSVGIIGGADAPTYSFVLRSVFGGAFLWAALIGAAMIGVSLVLSLIGRNRKN